MNLVTGALQENSDGWFGEGAQTTAADGKFTPFLLVNDGYTTPGSYTYSATLTTYDDDGFGVVFGYQDPGNYYRVSFRNQAPGTNSRGFGQGVSVQKVSGGVISSLGASTAFKPTVSTVPSTSTPVNVEVKVDGTNWAVHVNGDTNPVLSGTDSGLAAGKVGVESWYQRGATSSNAKWGVETSQVTVSDAGGTLFKDTFASGLPVHWRSVQMTNSAGVTTTGLSALGGFRQNFRSGTISEDSNAYLSATATTPNTDFLGPAIVVNDTGSTSLANYEMKVRLSNLDNDGIGVLVRALDDSNFYRINFTAESDAATTTWKAYERAPQGMSIQKLRNGVWTQLYRDDPASPDFWTYKDGTAGDPVRPGRACGR